MNIEIAELISHLHKLGIEVTEPTANQIYAFVEQKEANRQARELRRNGVCPTCGHETRDNSEW